MNRERIENAVDGDRDTVETAGVALEYVFDEHAADRVCAFFPRFLRHVKGELAGEPLHPPAWFLERVLRPVFGWKRADDGFRRFRTVFLFVARKNAKSTLGAGVATYCTFADGEKGAEVYSAAADREQAGIVFGIAQSMVEDSRDLRKRSRVYRRSILVPATRSVYKVISSDAKTKHGFNAHAVIIDELHAIPGAYEGSIVEVLVTSQGSRRQPLNFYLTTAGFDKHSIAYREYTYACKVRDGVVTDATYLPVIYEAPDKPELDIHDPDVWALANPSLGQSVYVDYLKEKAQRAVDSPVDENTFRRLHLNQWTEQDVRWVPAHKWAACADAELSLDDLRGQTCTAGLDLSSTEDLSSFALAFELDDGRVAIFVRSWCPEETAHERQLRERVPYLDWIAKGVVETTPGNVIDYEHIRTAINELADLFEIRQIAYDPWNATQLAVQLDQDGLELVPHRQGFASFAAPMLAFQRLWKGGELVHDGNPLLVYQAGNIAVEQDAAGNLKPSKRRSGDKIDGLVAAIMAVGRLVLEGDDEIGDADDLLRVL